MKWDFQPRALDYEAKKRKSDPERFERNGWLGLILTLILCAVTTVIYYSGK